MDLKRYVSRPGLGRHKRLAGTLTVVCLVTLAVGLSAVSLALAAAPSFPDVPVSHPYYVAITDLAGRGVISGYTSGNFGPADNIMRQQFAKMNVLAGGYPVTESDICPFLDVVVSGPADLYPDNYVAVAAQHHLTVGKTPTVFDPYSFITRYQVVTMVVRMILDKQPALLVMPPNGYSATAGWDSDPLHGPNAAVAEYNGLLAGLNLTALSPYGFMTRGEAAVVLHNALLKLDSTTTTTTAPSTTTTASTTTTTTGSTTTTTGSSTTTTVASTTTTTTVPSVPPATDYTIAGLEQNSVVVGVKDQFGNPLPNVVVNLTSVALEGSGLTLMSNLNIGMTDATGNVSHTWGQPAGAWGVEQVTATAGSLSKTVATVQWIYDDRTTDNVSAVAGQQKVSVAPGYSAWNGDMLRAYLAPAAASLGSGTYVSSTGVIFSVAHTWASTEAYFVGASSTNSDAEPNWMYNVVP